jgi:hypothetical protein
VLFATFFFCTHNDKAVFINATPCKTLMLSRKSKEHNIVYIDVVKKQTDNVVAGAAQVLFSADDYSSSPHGK